MAAGRYLFRRGCHGYEKRETPCSAALDIRLRKLAIDFIITKSISRFARNTVDCLEVVRKLTDIGVLIYFESENINTQTMDGELMLTILSGLAESESISISQNTKWAVQKRFRDGTFRQAYTPYGYDYKNDIFEINEKQVDVVKRIFSEALSGKGTQKIADGLNADGIKPKESEKWSGTTILGMLVNERYAGDTVFQKTYTDDHFKRHRNYGKKEQIVLHDSHNAIINHDDFDAVGRLLKQRGMEKGIQKGIGKYQNRYPLTGKIICSECGSHFKRRIHSCGGKQYIAWCCTKHLHDITECSMRFVRESDVHNAFIRMVNKLIYGQSFILKPLIHSLRSQDYSHNLKSIQELEQKTQENAEKSRVLSGLFSQGYLEPHMYNDQSNRLRAEASMLKEEKNALFRSLNGGVAASSEVEKLHKWVSKANTIDSFDEEFFKLFIESIAVYSQSEFAFKFKCGLTLRERLVD